MGPLAAHPQNPRYFQNTATGEVVYLTGSHTWPNLVDMGPSDPPPAFDFEKCVEWMAGSTTTSCACGRGNWSPGTRRPITSASVIPRRRCPHAPDRARAWPSTASPSSTSRSSTRSTSTGSRARVLAAGERGIYVSVMLFEGWGLQFCDRGVGRATRSIRGNNVNGIDGDPNGDGKGLEVHALASPAVTAIQEAYVRKVIDTVNDLDNVLYEISNENHPPLDRSGSTT